MTALWIDAWRGVASRRAATLVAMTGLTLAMAACILAGLLAIAWSDPDPSIPDPERVVVLDFRVDLPGRENAWSTQSPVAFATLLKERGAPLAHLSRFAMDGLDIEHEGRRRPALLLLADPDLVPLLGLRTLSGDLQATLGRHDAVAINQSLLSQLWGRLPAGQALGRRIESHGKVYTVGAVLPDADPRGPFGWTNPMTGNATAWAGYASQANARPEEARSALHEANGRVFARLQPGAQAGQVGGWMREAFVASAQYARLPAEWKARPDIVQFRAVPLTRLPFEGETNALRWSLLGAVSGASALLLALAAFNTMNLQVAVLLQRQRETALRRSLGADGLQLLRLWGLEALIPLAGAAAAALLLAWWCAPAVANWVDLAPAHPFADPMPGRVLLGLALGVALLLPLTIGWPAWTALRRAPAPALQGRTASEGPWGRRVRQGLLTLQLSGALLLLALAGVMALQQRHLLQADRGYETHNRLWLGVLVDPERVPDMSGFVGALERHPAVTRWAYSNLRPSGDMWGPKEWFVGPGGERQMLRVSTVSPRFFDTWAMRVLAGQPRTGEGEVHVVIDAKAARALGFASPQAAVGEIVRGGGDSLHEGVEPRRVVAVIHDVKLETAREPALPQAFVLSDNPQWDLTLHGPELRVLRQAVADTWRAHGPPLEHRVASADELRADVYRQESQLTTALAAVALLSVAVAMLGAYALVADTLRRRRTELVLCRLHGAGPGAIARRVAAEFAWPLAAAAAIALPLAAALGTHYVDGFVDRVDVFVGVALPLAVASLVTPAVTALAALRHLRIALKLQPGEALR
jgi:putative ABC transport system permease protein